MSGHKKAAARVAALEASVKLTKANIEEIKATIVTMYLYAPFDGTVVEKQGEVGEIITPTAMSSSLGRTAVVTIANLEHDGRRDRHLREPDLWRIALGQPAVVSVERDPVQALSRPAPAGDPDGRPDARHRQGQGRDPRPRRQALPRTGRDRPLPAQRDGQQSRTPAGRSCSCPSRRSSRRTGTTTSGSSARRQASASGRSRSRPPPTTSARVESGLEVDESVVLNPIKALHDDEIVRIAD